MKLEELKTTGLERITFDALLKENILLAKAQISISQLFFPNVTPEEAMNKYVDDHTKEPSYSWFFKTALEELYNEGADLLADLNINSVNRDAILVAIKNKMVRIKSDLTREKDLKIAA